MRRNLLLYGCTLLLLCALAQPAAARDSTAWKGVQLYTDPVLESDTASCVLPMRRVGKLILLKGRVDSVEGNFVLDTGAPGLVLNRTYFRQYPITEQPEATQTSITGGGAPAQQTVVPHFRLGTLHYYRVEADLVNLAHIEASKGVKILGLLGVALFRQCELIIDYQNDLVYLHHISRKERNIYRHAMLADPANYASYPFDLKDNRIIVKSSWENKELQFVVDYAAESNIIDSRLPQRLLDSVQISGRVLLSGAGNKKVEALSGSLSGVRVGSLDVGEMPVIVTNLENTCFGTVDCINGVLGYDFLSKYKLAFNFVKRKLYIIK